MSRKHRRSNDFFEEIAFEKAAEDFLDTLNRERKIHERLQVLSSAEQRVLSNKVHARKTPSDYAILKTLTCQMPKCDRNVLRLAGDSLGICYIHAAAIQDYFNIIGEDFDNQLARVDRIERRAWEQQKELKHAESRKLSPGWIYYVEVAGRIKIGYTADLKRRMRQYPPDSPLLAMHPGTKQLEAELHRQFASSRAAGREWYLDVDEIRAHIRTVIAEFGEPDRARFEHRGRMNSGLRAAPPKPTGISR